MIKIKNKYIYEVNQLNNYLGMMPLDIYVTLIYFNYNDDEYKDTLFTLYDLSQFLTECLVEALTREKIDFSKLNVTAKDFYISAIPNVQTTDKILIFKHENRKILISEVKLFNSDHQPMQTLKIKSITKEELLPFMLSIHKLSLSLMDDVIKKCNKSKKLSLVGVDEKENNDDDNFDMKKYENIG